MDPSIQQNHNCTLLQLPSELRRLILRRLPCSSRIVLSYTCRRFQSLLGCRRGAVMGLSHKQRVAYLSSVVRGLPGHWACEDCLELHPIVENDTPQTPVLAACPRRYSPLRLQRCHYEQFHLNHRHLQLTLKYTHLGNENLNERQQNYLDILLRPVCCTVPLRILGPGVRTAYLSFHPRVVKGRYILRSVWQYNNADKTVAQRVVNSLSICRHQRKDAIQMYSNQAQAVSRPIATLFQYRHLSMAIMAAFEAENTELSCSCDHCGTDVSVRASREGLIIRAWQDLGPEDSPYNLAWRIHVADGHFRDFVSHRSGSARELYESCGGDGDIESRFTELALDVE